MAHHVPHGKWKGKSKNNFCRSSKVNRIIAYFICLCVYVCVCLPWSSALSALALDHFPSACVCVSTNGWEKLGGREHKDTSEETHRQPPPPPSQPPSSLLPRWACTLAVAPAASAEARLLFKAASSFGLFFFFFFFFSLFFPLMSTEWLQRASCLSHTHLIYKTTKDKKNDRIEEEEESQNKMGTAVARLFLPSSSSSSSSLHGVRKNTFSKFPPSSPNNAQIQACSREGFVL